MHRPHRRRSNWSRRSTQLTAICVVDGLVLVLAAVWVAQERSLSVLPTLQVLVGCSVLVAFWAILSLAHGFWTVRERI